MKILSLLIALCCMAAAVPAAADLLPPPPRFVPDDPFSTDVRVEPDFAMVRRADAGGKPVPCFTVTVPGPCSMSVTVSARTEPAQAWKCYVHKDEPLAARFLIPVPASALKDGEKAVFSMNADVKLHRYQKASHLKKEYVDDLRLADREVYLFMDEQGPKFRCSHSAVLEKKGGDMLPADDGGQAARDPGG
ncbi:MAG: hypothetical protein IKS68_08560, partial [Mailhella sp.]|nr:hypothetical protein [Mailhella sp.]